MVSLGDIQSVVGGIRMCVEQAELVISNRKACGDLATDLGIIYDILEPLTEEQVEAANKYKLKQVLIKLVRIKNFVKAVPIKEKLAKLYQETAMCLSMLHLVFEIARWGKTKGGEDLPIVNDSDFDNIKDETRDIDEYYVDTDEDEEA